MDDMDDHCVVFEWVEYTYDKILYSMFHIAKIKPFRTTWVNTTL